jgi:soluble lytic murein transglycosylase-like protein
MNFSGPSLSRIQSRMSLQPGGGVEAIEKRVAALESMIRALDGPNQPPDTTPPPSFASFIAPAGAAKSSVETSDGTITIDRPPIVNLPMDMRGRYQALQPIVERISREHGVEKALLNAVIRQESGFNPNAVSHAGALGLMQLMPGTAAGLGVTNPKDPEQNIMGGAKYLRSLLIRFNGNIPLALAAYNAGPNAVSRYGGVPPYRETQNYVRSVMKHYLSEKS